MAGYHLEDITKGQFGEKSKIIEELKELRDAMNQGNRIMLLQELSDIIGAIIGYYSKHDSVNVPSFWNTNEYYDFDSTITWVNVLITKLEVATDENENVYVIKTVYNTISKYINTAYKNLCINDLHIMALTTKRVFESGVRK